MTADSARSRLMADYVRLYDGRGESAAELRSRAPARFLTNPSLHAVAMMRAVIGGPAAIAGVWRRLLESKHGIAISRDCQIGPGLVLPHPFELRLAPGIEVGADAMLYHNVTIGDPVDPSAPPPRIGDRVIVHMNAVILPGAEIGAGAVVGANAVVQGEVPEGATVKGERVIRPTGGSNPPTS